MATRKDGKVVVTFRGGPYSGCRFPKSPWFPSLTFTAKGYHGYYDAGGKWNGILIGNISEPNDNIVLSGTE